MIIKRHVAGWLIALLCAGTAGAAASRHSPGSAFPSYAGRVMCGYQGWFRAAGDGSHEGWVHFGVGGKFETNHLHIDYWPDTREYPDTYPTPFVLSNGQPARVFSSWDASTVDVHFRWLRDYGIDGVFVQRFFEATRTEPRRRQSRVVLEHALAASQKYHRAIAVMYDLSGLNAPAEDCSSIITDWKELVDQLKLTRQGTNQTYLYHHGKPLVAIWGLGFPDRPYNIHQIGVEKLIAFLKDDPEYGGCAVLLGVPTYFRTLQRDCVADPYLHQLIESADVVLPWMVGRYSTMQPAERTRYLAQLKADLAWCAERHLNYAPCVYPGFSWFNLSKTEFGGANPINQIPRQKGRFYWNQITAAKEAGARMLYVAMFDEMDEGTAIFKCSNATPTGASFLNYEGLPADYYLWLTGRAGALLRGELPFSKELPPREQARQSPTPSTAK